MQKRHTLFCYLCSGFPRLYMMVSEIDILSQTKYSEFTFLFHRNNKHANIGCEKEKAYQKALYEDAKKAYAALMMFYPLTLEDFPGEIWEWIRGYEGDYQESTFGRTKSFKRNTPRILVPTLHSSGYLHIGLNKNGKGKNFYAHRLVAETFIPNPENKPEINHEDGCKLNNFVGNLTWVTDKENNLHAQKMGLIKSGEDNYQAAFIAEQIREIRRIYIKGDREFGQAALARKFGVSRTAIQHIVNGKRYKNIE